MMCMHGPLLQAYQALVAKHSQLAQEHRKLLEQWGDAAVSDGTEEVLAVRQQLADLIPRYDAACDTVAELRSAQWCRAVLLSFLLLRHFVTAIVCCAVHRIPIS